MKPSEIVDAYLEQILKNENPKAKLLEALTAEREECRKYVILAAGTSYRAGYRNMLMSIESIFQQRN